MSNLAIIHETTGTWGALPFLTINESYFGMAKIKNTKLIPLTQGYLAIVDAKDYAWLMQWKWCLGSDKYAKRAIPIAKGKQKTILMHRFIMNTSDGMLTDHINGNRLDNRRCNLRICTATGNARNGKKPQFSISSKYKGVTPIKRSKKWQVSIGVNYKAIYLGSFSTQEEAAMVYNKAALKYHGEFARLNII